MRQLGFPIMASTLPLGITKLLEAGFCGSVIEMPRHGQTEYAVTWQTAL